MQISSHPLHLLLAAGLLCGAAVSPTHADHPSTEPVVARVEMKLAVDEKIIDVIEKGDLLTVLEATDDEYVIMTHDGTKGAIEKVNAVQIAESGDIYTELIQLHPNEGRFFTLRAAAWWALGKTEKALEDFDKAIELGYTEAHAYTSRGLFHAAMGNYDDAISDYNEALKIDPQDIAPLINRAAVNISKRDFAAAVADYTAALKRKPDSVTLLHQRAIARKAGGDLEKAVDDFNAILKQQPDNYAAMMGRGYVRFQQENFKAAAADFGTAIELNPQDAVAWNNRGYNLHQIDRHSEALENYDEAIKLAPKYALAHQNRAWLLATTQQAGLYDPKAAIESATVACQLTNFESVGELSALAAALAADGQFDKAIGWQEKVVELSADSHQPFAEKILDRYRNERPFAHDPDKANADEQAAAEQEAAKQQAKSTVADDSNA